MPNLWRSRSLAHQPRPASSSSNHANAEYHMTSTCTCLRQALARKRPLPTLDRVLNTHQRHLIALTTYPTSTMELARSPRRRHKGIVTTAAREVPRTKALRRHVKKSRHRRKHGFVEDLEDTVLQPVDSTSRLAAARWGVRLRQRGLGVRLRRRRCSLLGPRLRRRILRARLKQNGYAGA